MEEKLTADDPKKKALPGSLRLPPSAGAYVVGETTYLYYSKRPLWVHRFFCKLLLGWKWEDTKR